jgi:hypothetical protein
MWANVARDVLYEGGTMNKKRLLVGGLAAGLFIDIVEGGLSRFIIGEQFRSEMNTLGVTIVPSAAMGLFFVSWGFIVGLVTLTLYASAAPRLGGVRAATLVALGVWLVHGLLPHLRDGFIGVFSMSLSLKLAAIQLAWQVVATAIGALIYGMPRTTDSPNLETSRP